jgi:polyvinyl alcohol dehydrogenase (cytochrome)
MSDPNQLVRHAAGLLVVFSAALPLNATAGGSWPMFGQNPQNTASAGSNSLQLKNVPRLAQKWVFTTGGDVSARPAVVDGAVYFPDWGGNLWAVDAKKGTKVWGHALSDYGLAANTNSRTTPAVKDGVVYLGTQEGAWLLAISAKTGALLWKTQLEPTDRFAIISASPVIVGGMVYTGVASTEEAAAAFGAPCCNSRGSVVAVNATGAAMGSIAWKTYMTPSGYSGAGVWGSNFAVDAQRGTVFVGTGNNYSHPTDPAYVACISAGGTAASCSSPDNHVDSIVALDMNTGAIKWATKAVRWGQEAYGVTDGSDDWNVACFIPPFTACPSNPGPDYDFASAPNLITYTAADGSEKTILGAGQKSGIYYAMDPDTGAVIWQTQVGPGSSLGGMEWGSASDGKRIYVSIANFYGIPTRNGSAGSWSALDPATGAILWQVGEPSASIALGPLTVAGDAVFVSSMAGSSTAPTMLALNGATGQVVWTFASGSSVNAGPAVVDGVVYWGSGYAHLGIPGYTGNNKLFAFSVEGR